jgi:hypothetical protein
MSMNVAVVEQFGQSLVLREWEVPVPAAGQIVLKTAACGVTFAIWRGGLQLSASGSIWGARLFHTGCLSAVGADERLFGRGVCSHRATAAYAVASGGGSTWSGRRRRICRSPSSGSLNPRHIQGESKAPCEPDSQRPAPHDRHYLSRCQLEIRKKARTRNCALAFLSGCV